MIGNQRAMKASGVRWMCEIPEKWEVVQLRRVFRIENGSTPRSSEDAYWGGAIAWVTPDDLGRLDGPEIRETARTITNEGHRSCGTSIVPAGSLILSTRAPIGHLAIAGMQLCTNQGCRSLIPRQAVSSRYFYYLLLTARPEFAARGQGSTFQELSADNLNSVALCRPPLEEQRAIAEFLDRKTAAIGGIIRKKERLIELLREKRQAAISRAVTRGLDPTVPMKDSGVKWIDRIPLHWDVKQLRYLIKHGTSITYGIVQAGPNIEGGIPYIRTSDMAGRELPCEGYLRTSPEIDAAYRRSKVSAGDLVVAIRATVGKTLVVPDCLDEANLTQGTAKISPGAGVIRDFLYWTMNSSNSQHGFASFAKGATFKEITLEMLRQFSVPFPPVDEQQAISSFLNEVARRYEDTGAKLEEQIVRLREYRQTLISNAVTGKIDVREAVPA